MTAASACNKDHSLTYYGFSFHICHARLSLTRRTLKNRVNYVSPLVRAMRSSLSALWIARNAVQFVLPALWFGKNSASKSDLEVARAQQALEVSI